MKALMRSRKDRGLVELLVVVSLVAVIAVIAFSTLTHFRRKAAEAQNKTSTATSSPNPNALPVATPAPTSAPTAPVSNEVRPAGEASKKEESDELSPALLTVILGAAFAGIAYIYKTVMAQVTTRAELFIIEALSSGERLSREELQNKVNQASRTVRWIRGLFIDTLSGLVSKKLVSITHRKFHLAPKEPDPRKSQ